jgi:hypothetical protein
MATAPGEGVDKSGQPVIDPTKNVLDLFEAGMKRQDDLRTITAANLQREMEMRAEFEERLRKAESDRLDAIRLVDSQQVQRAAEVQATAALALANQVAASAETLRNQVAAADSAGNVRLAAALEPMQKDIADLRRVQYETAGGKTQVVEARASTGVNLNVIGIIIAAAGVVSAFILGGAGIAITLLLR